jgi:glycosyltransferase involved in cell wall biosynthesis
VTAIERIRPASQQAARLRIAAGRGGTIRGRGAGGRLRRRDVEDALAGLRAGGHARPILLAYHQSSPDNPFQTLLYRRARAHGIAPLAVNDLDDLALIADVIAAEAAAGAGRGGRRPTVAPFLHLHWVNRVLRGATSDEDAAERTAAMARRLDGLHARGWTSAFTVHNILPHDAARPAAEATLRQAIVDRVDVVHVMVSTTAELAAPLYRIPAAKIVHVPIPSFRGAYADAVDRDSARFALGLPADSRVAVVVGGLRPYKGLDVLLDAWERTAGQAPDLRLVIAGPPDGSPGIDAFLARAAADPRVQVHARMIPGDDLQLFLRAADVAVLPYVRTLNSAVLMLVLAFDLAVIGPDLGGIPEALGGSKAAVDPALATLFPAGDVEALATALTSIRPRSDATAAAARRVSDAHDADRVSDRLMAALVDAVDRRWAERPGDGLR